MATIDILTVFDSKQFRDNVDQNFSPNNPEGSGGFKFADDKHLRMISDSDRVKVTPGKSWQLEVRVQEGDVLRWLDTSLTQGEQEDMLVYNFGRRDERKWNAHLTPLKTGSSHATRFFITSGFGTQDLTYQYSTEPNNILTATVKSGLSLPPDGVSLNYDLNVVKLGVEDQEPQPKGYYAIDPTIRIMPHDA